MSVFSRIRNLFFNCASQITHSAEDRVLFRTIRERKVRSIVELGVADGTRALRMIEAASRQHAATVTYTGIDLFEARDGDARGLSLKELHRKLKPTRARVRLVPGDPLTALARTANSLGGTDLVVISADQAGLSLDRAWFYVPRLLAPEATVLIEATDPKSGERVLQPLSRLEVESRAAAARPRRAA